ncbi:hypothetical protein LPJ61_005591, partial [Coemansia biformis]
VLQGWVEYCCSNSIEGGGTMSQLVAYVTATFGSHCLSYHALVMLVTSTFTVSGDLVRFNKEFGHLLQQAVVAEDSEVALNLYRAVMPSDIQRELFDEMVTSLGHVKDVAHADNLGED